MSTIEIRKISITELDTDAVVNAANEGLMEGGGVCGAIFGAAGRTKLHEACAKIGHCDTGSAVITPGFGLKAKYVIHAVGPVYKDGRHNEPELLYGAYYKALELALENSCRSVGFPLLSAGIYGYPVRDAWSRALAACGDFLSRHNEASLQIVFAVLQDQILEVGRKMLAKGRASRFKVAERGDWETVDMPEKRDSFTLHRHMDPAQMAALRGGNIPRGMEDKWFWFMEGDTLYAHRSWSGFCIYRVEFGPNGDHLVTVNRDPEQYSCTSAEEDAQTLNGLLDMWSETPYDYQDQWLRETLAAVKKAGGAQDGLMLSGRKTNAVFFHKPEEPYGFLSNWYRSPFELDGQRFTSAEQYIMYRKCKVFGDEASAAAVLASDDTAAQQTIGRNASGYDQHVWAGMRQMVAFRALTAKFTQNEELRRQLMETGDAVLVECAGSDKVWACGVRLNDDKRSDTANWSGDNILGFALMEVREMLRD